MTTAVDPAAEPPLEDSAPVDVESACQEEPPVEPVDIDSGIHDHADQAARDAAEDEADTRAADTALDDVAEPTSDSGASPPDQTPTPAAESSELPVHRVVCMTKGCKSGALYRPMASGNGFLILERYGMDVETVIGIGPNGRPVCPIDGHGEMTLADEQLPAAEAIAQVAEKVERQKGQPKLPYPVPAFNFEGAFNTIIDKRHEVKADEEKWEELKERTKKAKDRLDEGNEQLGKMIDDYEERIRERRFEQERRQAQAEAGHPEGTTLVRCVWEEQHPDDPCPLCAKGMSIGEREAIVRILGAEILPRDASGHIGQVGEYRNRLDVQRTVDWLDGLIFGIPASVVAAWSPEEKKAVRTWAHHGGDPHQARPSVLGTPHVAAAVDPGAKVQTCATCGAVLKQLDDVTEAYRSGALVRTDCAGAEPEGHRYPDATKKPRRSRKKTRKGRR
jgi:hypothetical protein